jgi:hypothetical protein
VTFKDEEIEEVVADSRRLPTTHRRGYPSSTDDVAEDADGNPTKVPTSGNPEDRFSE